MQPTVQKSKYGKIELNTRKQEKGTRKSKGGEKFANRLD